MFYRKPPYLISIKNIIDSLPKDIGSVTKDTVLMFIKKLNKPSVSYLKKQVRVGFVFSEIVRLVRLNNYQFHFGFIVQSLDTEEFYEKVGRRPTRNFVNSILRETLGCQVYVRKTIKTDWKEILKEKS